MRFAAATGMSTRHTATTMSTRWVQALPHRWLRAFARAKSSSSLRSCGAPSTARIRYGPTSQRLCAARTAEGAPHRACCRWSARSGTRSRSSSSTTSTCTSSTGRTPSSRPRRTPTTSRGGATARGPCSTLRCTLPRRGAAWRRRCASASSDRLASPTSTPSRFVYGMLEHAPLACIHVCIRLTPACSNMHPLHVYTCASS